MVRIVWILLVLLVINGPLPAQEHSGPAADAPAETAQFDFLVGDWLAEYEASRPDGTTSQLTAHWRIEYILDGHALQDNWDVYDREGEKLGSGTMFRTFDAEKGHWTFVELTTWRLTLHSMWGEKQGDTMVMYEETTTADGAPALARRVFTHIGPDSFYWRYDVSTDEGKTWDENVAHMKATRKRQ